jgi:alpha-L-rhamnosidase
MDKVWKAKWIMDRDFYGVSPVNMFHKQKDPEFKPQKHKEDLLNRHMLVRKKFTINNEFSNSVISNAFISNAYIDITADDYYKLYINGTFVGQGPAPSYYFHYYYNRYDISKYLVQGENVIAVRVYYQGLVNRVWNSGDYRQGMIAEVYVDGKLAADTDSSWKYTITKAYATHGAIGYDTQFSEDIDSRLIDAMWRDIDYDDSNWLDAFESITDDHKLFLQETSPVVVYEVKPEIIRMIKPGHYFIDFRHEITGQFKMKASGKPGDVIEIRCGEETEEDQPERVRFKLRCNVEYREMWTLSGKGTDALEFFDYKVFRYVEVEGPEYAVNPSEFAAVVRHYLVDDSLCTLEASDKILEKVWTICKNGVKYGTQEGYLKETRLFADAEHSQHSALHSNALPLLFGLVSEEDKSAVVDFIRKKGLCCGVYMAYFVLKALAKAGEYGLVYDFITKSLAESP